MAGLSTIDDVWSVPIDNTSLLRGENWNSGYVVGGFEPQWFLGDVDLTVTKDSQPIRNYDEILALLLRDTDELTIKTFPTNGKDRYDLVEKAQDIVYVARYINSYIVSASSTSVCDLTKPVSDIIAKYDARFIANNLGGKLVCRITLKSTGVQYIRAFSISGLTITLLDPITGNTSGITGLAGNDQFELINSYDVMMENLEATTGYPVKGYVKKHIVPNENGYIIFNPYDQPLEIPGEKVVISYRALENYSQIFSYDDSITKYGLYPYSNTLDFGVTQNVINTIETSLKVYSEPQITVELLTLRPTKPRKGWVLNFNVPDMVVGNFIVTGVNETYISPKGQKFGKPIRAWKVTCQNYTDTLAALIAGLKQKNSLSQAVLAQNLIQKTFFTYNLNYSFIDNPVQILKPTNLVASSVSTSGFTVTADPVAGASQYIYRVSRHSDFRDAPDGYHFPSPVPTPTVTINNAFILPNTLYYFDMAAIIGGIQTDWASLPSVTTTTPITDVLNFPINETSGSIITDTVSGIIGTLAGTSINLQSDGSGSGEVYLHSSNALVSVANSSSYQSTTKLRFTIKFNFTSFANTPELWIKYDPGGGPVAGKGYEAFMQTNGNISCNFYDGSGGTFSPTILTSGIILINTWHEVEISIDTVAHTFDAKVDGTPVSTSGSIGSFGPLSLTSNPFELCGYSPSAGYSGNGYLKSFSITKTF